MRDRKTSQLSGVTLVAAFVLASIALVITSNTAAAYTPHAPILIDGNAAFTAANGAVGGSGTPSDPFVIEGWEINSSSAHGIEVRNTNSHFVIRNVYVHSDRGPFATILLSSVGDARVESSLLETPDGLSLRVSQSVRVTLTGNNLRGTSIGVDSTRDIMIRANNVTGSGGAVGVVLSSNVTIAGNNLTSNPGGGILVFRSPNATVTGNWIEYGDGDGIALEQTDNATVSGNDVLGNTKAGVYGAEATNLTIVGNRLANNTWGVRLIGSRNVTVHHNRISDNLSPAADDQGPENAWDDGYPSGGNYWKDYGGADDCSGPNQDVCPDPDGIGDTPRVIDPDSVDGYPFFMGSPGPNEPPAIAVSSPSGGEVFSGGSTRTIQLQVSDPNDPWGSLRVWINYSLDGGSTWIPVAGAQGVPPDQVPPWTVPVVDTANARLRGEVSDPGGMKATDTSGAFAIDATPPTVVSTSPTVGDTNVSATATVVLTFGEPMNRSATETAITFESGAASVAFTAMWNGPSVFLDPVATLSPGVLYWVNVSSTAKDTSDPGNALSAAPYSLAFAAALGGDTNPPVADAGGPYQSRVGTPVTLDGTRSSDDTGIVNWTWTVEIESKTVTLYGPSPTYTFSAEGTYAVTLIVRDSASNVASDTAEVRVTGIGADGVDVRWFLVLLGVLVAVTAAMLLLAFLWKRRRQKQETRPPETR